MFVAYGVFRLLASTVTVEDSEAQSASPRRKAIIFLLFFPWTLLFLVACAPLMLLSSLYADGDASDHMGVVVYFVVHAFIIGFVFAVSPSSKRCCGMTNVLLGVAFAFASLSFSSFWFVGVAPIIDGHRRGVDPVPRFIWPYTADYLAGWIDGEEEKKAVWRCDRYYDQSDAYWHRHRICLTYVAAPLYCGLALAALLHLALHCVLAFVWPTCFPGEKEAKKEGEEEEAVAVAAGGEEGGGGEGK